MKKTLKKLTLKRETLKELSSLQLAQVAGGATMACTSGFTCLLSGCYSMTCYTQCENHACSWFCSFGC